MTPDPRSFDLRVRTVTTSVLALGVLGVTAYQAIVGNSITEPFDSWGGIIIGVYFGAHVSMNGSGARARQDERIVAAIAEPATGVVTTMPKMDDEP